MNIGLSLLIVGIGRNIQLCEIIILMGKIMNLQKAELVRRLETVSYMKLIRSYSVIIILRITILEMKFALITWTDVLSLGASKDVLWSGDEICQA